MGKRAIAVSGDMSTSKPPAKIIGSGRGKIMGLNMILERDRFQCPACNTTGYIICIGPRNVMNEIHAGQARAVALHGDICCCACEPKPRLNAVSQHVAHHILTDEIAAHHIQPESDSASTNSKVKFNDFYQLLDEDGVSIAHAEYALSINNGEPEYGITNAQGHTHLLASIAEQYTVDIYLES
jgi:uncharacterized Zn-binding protein involved in type VI secretion